MYFVLILGTVVCIVLMFHAATTKEEGVDPAMGNEILTALAYLAIAVIIGLIVDHLGWLAIWVKIGFSALTAFMVITIVLLDSRKPRKS